MSAEDKLKSEGRKAEQQIVEKKIEAPDGGYGWVVLVASFFISFILDGIMYSMGIVLGPIKRHYEVSDEVGNLMSSLNTGFLFCSGPIVAGLVNQFGCRNVVMSGAAVTSLMYFLTAFSSSFIGCIICYGVIGGLSTGITYIASLIIIADYFDKKLGIANGITMAGSGLGSFVFAPLIANLIQSYDWKIALTVCSCLILQTCVCGALLAPLNRSKSISEIPMLSDEEPKTKGNKFIQMTIGILKEMTDFKLLFQNMGFLLITASNFFAFVGYFAPFLYLIEITKVRIPNIPYNDSWLLSTIGIVNIPFRILFGFVADRNILSGTNLNTLSIILIMVTLFLIELFVKNSYLIIVFSVLFGIGAAGMNSLTTKYLRELVEFDKFSNAFGIINLFRGFGCFLGPVFAGKVKDNLGLSYTFYFSGICFIVGVAFALVVSFKGMLCRNQAKSENQRSTEAESDNNFLSQA